MNQPRFPHGQRWYAHCKINQPTLIDTFLQDCPRHLSRSSTWAKARCPRRVPQPWVLGMKVMESIIRAQLYWITLKRKSELECILLLLAINQNQHWDCFVYLCNVWILLGIRFTRIYILDPIGKKCLKSPKVGKDCLMELCMCSAPSSVNSIGCLEKWFPVMVLQHLC